MSSAEERLGKCDHAITVWDGREIAKNQKYTVDACYAYDLAREAIALLRRLRDLPGADLHVHYCAVSDNEPCTCGLTKVNGDADKFLDGEPDVAP